jgi:Flp pilus assembly protein TadG
MAIAVRPAKLLFGRTQFHRFGNDCRGTTAIELGILFTPFVMFIIMFMLFALYFFTISSIEKGMDQASRMIRTGQAVALKWTVDDFRKAICQGADATIDCTKVQVWTQPYSDWSAITSGANVDSNGLHSCVDKNNAVLNNANYSALIATQAGTASNVVIVTVCYPWDFASKLPFFKIGNMQNGSLMIQSSTAFRTEPYPNASGS